MVQLSATRCSCVAILWVSLVSFVAITLCVASQRVFIIVVYFVIDSVRKILDTPSYAVSLIHVWTRSRVRVNLLTDSTRHEASCLISKEGLGLWQLSVRFTFSCSVKGITQRPSSAEISECTECYLHDVTGAYAFHIHNISNPLKHLPTFTKYKWRDWLGNDPGSVRNITLASMWTGRNYETIYDGWFLESIRGPYECPVDVNVTHSVLASLYLSKKA
jgi:hypothetical protein